jgi:pimeloyl-ACP methyl ester carboxylesterase
LGFLGGGGRLRRPPSTTPNKNKPIFKGMQRPMNLILLRREKMDTNINHQEQIGTEGKYAPINGLNMYYEVHGTRQPETVPLVLLHGALSGIGTSFGSVLPAFSNTRQVIAIEQQAHARTADIDRPLRIEQMADDTVALLQQIGVQKADIFGYSMGAGIALDIAIRYPQMVRKQVLAAISYNEEGLHPGLLDGIEQLQPEHLHGSPFHEEYMRTAPRPEDFPTLIERVKEFDSDIHSWPAEAIRSIQSPTMLIFGDSDIVRPEHAVEIFRLLGGGVVGDTVGLPRARLAVLPGTTHITLVHRADWLVSMITEFLDAVVAEE